MWRSLEGDIVSSDSGARNLSAALYKIIQRQERDRRRELNAPNLRARLAILAGDQDRDEAAKLEKLGERDLAYDRRFDARDAMRLREQEAEADPSIFDVFILAVVNAQQGGNRRLLQVARDRGRGWGGGRLA